MIDNNVEVSINLLRISPNLFNAPNDTKIVLKKFGVDCMNFLQERKIDSLLYLSCFPESVAQNIYNKIWINQRQLLIEFINSCRKRGIIPLVLKGAEVVEHYYCSKPISFMDDVDVLVRRQDIVSAMEILYILGLKPGVFDRQRNEFVNADIKDIAKVELNHYELPSFSLPVQLDLTEEEMNYLSKLDPQIPIYLCENKSILVVTLDVHYGVATNIDSEQFFERSISSCFNGAVTMSIPDYIWFTTSRFYTEVAMHGKRSLRDFAYLLAVISNSKVNWDSMLEMVKKYDLGSSLYYYFYFMNAVINNLVPPKIINELHPQKGGRFYDWGWQLSKLFNIVDPYPLSSYQINTHGLLLK